LARALGTDELRKCASAVRDLFEEHFRQFDHQHYGRPELTPFQGGARIYPVGPAASSVEFTCLSPWEEPLLEFIEMINVGIDARKAVAHIHSKCNLVSGGFLVRYGKAQVLLGGDMEASNWRALRDSSAFIDINPCVVKVSHHGSRTSCTDGMWGANGFLGRHKPMAVITPWNKTLPDWDVIEEIRSSCGHVYLTGVGQPRIDDGLPHIHLRVSKDASVQVVHRSPSVQRIH
jgi:hypothetical protein